MLERTLNGSFGFTSQGALVANFPPAVIGPFGEIGRQTKDPVLTQEVARHRNLETTQGYFHARRDRRYAAVAGLGRAVKS